MNINEMSQPDSIDQTDFISKRENIEGLENTDYCKDVYPLDSILIRQETRTVQDVMRRIDHSTYILDPEFQRDFIWDEDKQSKLIESVIMRIPLPVFYMGEDEDGKMIVVDGLQRLTTFHRFLRDDQLKLRLKGREDINGKFFSGLSPKMQNRIEDCNLIFYIIDSKAPERVRLDIFERVNGGVPLTRQQMRNCLYMGKATKFLKNQAKSDSFIKATEGSLNTKSMRDREFVNRFCAFQLFDFGQYAGNMDDFLAKALRKMNQEMNDDDLLDLANKFLLSLNNNKLLFERQAFRRHFKGDLRRGIINASLWDVMSTGLSIYKEEQINNHKETLLKAFYDLLINVDFIDAITNGTNDTRKVNTRFTMTQNMFKQVLGC